MYESPINIMVGDIKMQMVQKQEQTIFNAIRKCSVDVDKDELIKALNYDRNQYSKGYEDGANDILNKVRAEIEFEVDRRTNMLCAEDVFEIIDKYRAESEGARNDRTD